MLKSEKAVLSWKLLWDCPQSAAVHSFVDLHRHIWHA